MSKPARDTHDHQASDMTSKVIVDFDKLIAQAPAQPEPVKGAGSAPRAVSHSTGLPKRYRDEWPRPEDHIWSRHFSKLMAGVDSGGIIALIGPRGTGKTRLAAEALRNFSPDKGLYVTAMGLFLRIRASFGKISRETESDIVNELAGAPILILDEIQERSNSAWEDRVLTHIIDRRYGSMAPTIVIANLTLADLVASLGESIASRITETGGAIEIAGPSHRIPNRS